MAPVASDKWDQNAIDVAESFINNADSKVSLVVRGREPEGRLEVDILKNDRISLGQMLKASGNAESAPSLSCSSTTNDFKLEKYEKYISESFVKEKSKATVPSEENKYSSQGEDFECVTSHAADPFNIYVMKIKDVEQFEDTMKNTQDSTMRLKGPKRDDLCLVFHDGLWNRARIVSIADDEMLVLLFLIDRGITVYECASKLMELENKVSGEGLVHHVGLKGIEPPEGESVWSSEAVDVLTTLLEPGEGKLFICKTSEGSSCDLLDTKGNSVQDQLMKAGVARIRLQLDSNVNQYQTAGNAKMAVNDIDNDLT